MTDEASRPDLLLRYAARDRMLHWLIVIAFVLLAASGLALFHPALFGLSALLGGGPWSAVLHPFLGVAMAAGLAAFAWPRWAENRIEARDRQWLRAIGDVINRREDRVPEAGKYNAGQKLFYLAALALVALLLVTGIVIWRRYFSAAFPVGVVRWAVLGHAAAAAGLVLAIIVHVAAAASVSGSLAAMTRGTVTLGWAFKHHRAWFRTMVRPTGDR